MIQPSFDFEPEKEVAKTIAFRTLELLRTGPKSTKDLLCVGVRPAAYVRNLRQQGYIISTCKSDEGIAVYTLEGKVEQVEVTDEMKAAYYVTSHWRAKRMERIAFDNYTCAVCKSRNALQVHHWKYDLFNEDIADLLTLCDKCHDRMHGYENVHCHFPRYVSPDIAKLLSAPHSLLPTEVA